MTTFSTIELSQDNTVHFAGTMVATGAVTVDQQVTYSVFPQAHAGNDSPIYGRTSTDGLTVAAWNLVDDSVSGDLFHFTTGANKASNANGCVIAIGVQYGGRGFFVNNYGPNGSGSHTIGYELTNLASNDDSQSYGFLAENYSTASTLFRLRASVAGSAPLLLLDSSVGLNAGTVLQKWSANGVEFGEVQGDTGLLDWKKDAKVEGAVIAPNLPTADPHVAGQLWNSSGIVHVSAG